MSHNFITTYTGKQIDPLDPDPAMIDIVDIAHHLACLNRFCGALERPYSVAEHSVRVSCLLSGRNALAGQLHDAGEAYLCDLPTPIKRRMGAYRDAEARLQAVIYERFGVGDFDREAVRRADEVMLHVEARDLFRDVPAWVDRRLALGAWPIVRVHGWKAAKLDFLKRFKELQASVKQLAEEN